MSEFEYAKAQGWIEGFKSAGAEFGFEPAILLGIASRETNMRNIVGDGGHGYGLMQIDIRSWPEFCHSGQWHNAIAGIHMGALVLKSKLTQLEHGQGVEQLIGGYAFNGPKFATKTEILRCAIAAYNAGAWAAYAYATHGDPDRFTTGHNYSHDVLARAVGFAIQLKELK